MTPLKHVDAHTFKEAGAAAGGRPCGLDQDIFNRIGAKAGALQREAETFASPFEIKLNFEEPLNSALPSPVHRDSLIRAITLAERRCLNEPVRVKTSDVTGSIGLFSRAVRRHKIFRQSEPKPFLSLIEKVLAPTESFHSRHIPTSVPVWLQWFREAIVYIDDDFSLKGKGLSPPRCFGIHIDGDAAIHLYLEDLGRFSHPRDRDQYVLVAGKIGEFGGWGNTSAAWKKAYLDNTEGTPIVPKNIARLEKVLEAATLTSSARDDIIQGYKFVIDNYDKLETVRRSSPLTVVHGDSHWLNYFICEPGMDVVAIDWTRVACGRLAEDLANTVRPWHLTLARGMTAADYDALERAMLEHYIDGVRRYFLHVDPVLIQALFDLRMVIQCLRDLVNPASIFYKVSSLPAETLGERRRNTQELLLTWPRRLRSVIVH